MSAPEQPVGLDACPITGRLFFMNMHHDELGYVATYGGPFDSYTIPALDDDGSELRCERYDHDAGHWVEGGENVADILTEDCKRSWIADMRAAADAKRAQPSGLSAGLEMAAKWIDARREAFEQEHGRVCFETGAMEFGRGKTGEAAEEFTAELAEIAEQIRALAARGQTP